jgi:hypothetical protein
LLFNEAGFAGFETDTVRHTFVLPSFDAYYGPFERGGGSTGQALANSPRKYAAPYAKKCGETWLTPADQSRRKGSTELRAAGAKSAIRERPPLPVELIAPADSSRVATGGSANGAGRSFRGGTSRAREWVAKPNQFAIPFGERFGRPMA